ncbi:putative reverse transcriptase domain-containing protein [Tanacetum coccineum]
MTKLTQKKIKFEWGDKQEAAFQLLKQKLYSAPILALPEEAKISSHTATLRRRVWALARKPEHIMSEDVGEMLVEMQHFQKLLENKSWKPRGGWNPVPHWQEFGYLSRPNIKGRQDCWYNPKYPNGSGITSPWILSRNFLRRLKIVPKELVTRHWIPHLNHLRRDPRYAIKFLEFTSDALGTNLDMSTAYHPQTDGQSERTIQTLEEMLRACAIDFGKVEKLKYSSRTDPETTEKIFPDQAKDASSARDRQKSYSDISVIERVGEVAYKLELPEELSRVHNTFHVSNLKKCHADEPLARSRDPSGSKVRLNSKRRPEFTWEREDQFKKKYPHLFTKTTPSSSAAL